MNERIEKLAVEARQYAFGEVENSQDPTEWSTKYYNEMFEQKFAELIVRECYEHCKGQVLDKEVADTNELSYNDAVGDCANGLLQHFGVDE
jgi:hypothetical protein